MKDLLASLLALMQATGRGATEVAGYVLIGLLLAGWLSMPTCPLGAHRALTAVFLPSMSWLPKAQWRCYAPDQGTFVAPAPGWRDL